MRSPRRVAGVPIPQKLRGLRARGHSTVFHGKRNKSTQTFQLNNNRPN